jgi:hypothetical protein
MAFKEDMQESVAELVYGEPLRMPGELLAPTAGPVDTAHLITELRQHMTRLRPVPAARHPPRATFVHSDLEKCTHVFLHQDTLRRILEPSNSGPYQVLSRREKTLQLLVRGRPVTVSVDRVKPAYMLNEMDSGTTTTTTFHPMVDATSAVAPPATARRTKYALRTPRIFPCSFQHLRDHLRGGLGGSDVRTTYIESSAGRSGRTTAAPTPMGSRVVGDYV